MRMSQVKERETPCVDTDKLLISFRTEGSSIASIRVVLKLQNKEKVFATKGNPLKAFKMVEKFVGKIS